MVACSPATKEWYHCGKVEGTEWEAASTQVQIIAVIGNCYQASSGSRDVGNSQLFNNRKHILKKLKSENQTCLCAGYSPWVANWSLLF